MPVNIILQLHKYIIAVYFHCIFFKRFRLFLCQLRCKRAVPVFLPQSFKQKVIYKIWFKAIKDIYYPTYCRLDGLLVGVAIASIFQYRPSVKAKLVKYANGLLALSILLLIAAYFLFGGSLVRIGLVDVIRV